MVLAVAFTEGMLFANNQAERAICPVKVKQSERLFSHPKRCERLCSFIGGHFHLLQARAQFVRLLAQLVRLLTRLPARRVTKIKGLKPLSAEHHAQPCFLMKSLTQGIWTYSPW